MVDGVLVLSMWTSSCATTHEVFAAKIYAYAPLEECRECVRASVGDWCALERQVWRRVRIVEYIRTGLHSTSCCQVPGHAAFPPLHLEGCAVMALKCVRARGKHRKVVLESALVLRLG